MSFKDFCVAVAYCLMLALMGVGVYAQLRGKPAGCCAAACDCRGCQCCGACCGK